MKKKLDKLNHQNDHRGNYNNYLRGRASPWAICILKNVPCSFSLYKHSLYMYKAKETWTCIYTLLIYASKILRQFDMTRKILYEINFTSIFIQSCIKIFFFYQSINLEQLWVLRPHVCHVNYVPEHVLMACTEHISGYGMKKKKKNVCDIIRISNDFYFVTKKQRT